MGKVKFVFVVCIVLGWFLGQPSATGVKDCLRRCHFRCVIHPRRTLRECCAMCMKYCTRPTPDNLKDTQYFCNLGCAYSSYTAFSSKDDRSEEKVADCVGSCSENCMGSWPSENFGF